MILLNRMNGARSLVTMAELDFDQFALLVLRQEVVKQWRHRGWWCDCSYSDDEDSRQDAPSVRVDRGLGCSPH